MYADWNSSIYGVMVIFFLKSKYVETWYNTGNIQILCITNVYYSTFAQLKTHVQSDQSDR